MPVIQSTTSVPIPFRRRGGLALLLGVAGIIASGQVPAGPGGLSAADEPTHAKDDTHWSFRPISLPPVPVPRRSDWIKNPIDAFVIDRLERVELGPAMPAEAARCYAGSSSTCWDCRRSRRRSRNSRPTVGLTPTSGWSIACWHRRNTASVGGGTGSTWCDMPTRPGSKPTCSIRTPGDIETT